MTERSRRRVAGAASGFALVCWLGMHGIAVDLLTNASIH